MQAVFYGKRREYVPASLFTLNRINTPTVKRPISVLRGTLHHCGAYVLPDRALPPVCYVPRLAIRIWIVIHSRRATVIAPPGRSWYPTSNIADGRFDRSAEPIQSS